MSKPSDFSQSPFHLLHRALRTSEQTFEHQLSALSLTARQHALLAAVGSGDGLNQKLLGAKIGMDDATTSDVVRRLVRRGILKRHRGADKRHYIVRLTEIGTQVLASSDKIAKEFDNRILELVPVSSRAALMRALWTMAGHAEGEHPPRPATGLTKTAAPAKKKAPA